MPAQSAHPSEDSLLEYEAQVQAGESLVLEHAQGELNKMKAALEPTAPRGLSEHARCCIWRPGRKAPSGGRRTG